MIFQNIQDNGIKEDKRGYFSIRKNAMVSGLKKKSFSQASGCVGGKVFPNV
jgi:hypothetical protein